MLERAKAVILENLGKVVILKAKSVNQNLLVDLIVNQYHLIVSQNHLIVNKNLLLNLEEALKKE